MDVAGGTLGVAPRHTCHLQRGLRPGAAHPTAKCTWRQQRKRVCRWPAPGCRNGHASARVLALVFYVTNDHKQQLKQRAGTCTTAGLPAQRPVEEMTCGLALLVAGEASALHWGHSPQWSAHQSCPRSGDTSHVLQAESQAILDPATPVPGIAGGQRTPQPGSGQWLVLTIKWTQTQAAPLQDPCPTKRVFAVPHRSPAAGPR